jgi:hemolysin III
MLLFDLREPINSLSHGAGMMLALPLTWAFWQRCVGRVGADGDGEDSLGGSVTPYQRGKTLSLLIFGLSLVICYGNSALYHAAWLSGPPLDRLRRLDHVGIYLLIAGTYTPAAWSLMRDGWRQGTLATVWGLAAFCAGRVWFGGILPTWMSTIIYLALGWGVLFCYRELARGLAHRTLLPLPLGGALYSVGALINLTGWPVLRPGVFGPHELFHFFVIAGSACHAYFMFRVVVPARQPDDWQGAGEGEFAVPGPARGRPRVRLSADLAGTIIRMARPATTRRDVGTRRITRPSVARLLWGASFVEAASGEGRPEPAVILNPAEP